MINLLCSSVIKHNFMQIFIYVHIFSYMFIYFHIFSYIFNFLNSSISSIPQPSVQPCITRLVFQELMLILAVR